MARDMATGKAGGASFGGGAAWGSGFGNTGGRKEGAEVVKAIYEGVWEKWKEEVKVGKDMGMEGRGARAVGDRFQPGECLLWSVRWRKTRRRRRRVRLSPD